jgi:hypothetical protein
MAWEDDTIEWLKRSFNKQSDATTLDLIQRLFKIQSGRNAPQKAMIEFTELPNELAAPETPTSYRALLRVVNEVCLPNTTKIHVCVNDCIAFYNSKFVPSYQFAGEQWELSLSARLTWAQWLDLPRLPRKAMRQKARGLTSGTGRGTWCATASRT